MQRGPEAALSTSQYKGKVTRWWPQLPEEIVRLIATHYLLDMSFSTYCPQTWENPKVWHQRMAYVCIRDTIDLEKHIMPICPEWRRAIEKHTFWNQAAHILDPNDIIFYHMAAQQAKQPHNGSSNASLASLQITAYHHLRNILNSSCFVCRINFTGGNTGLGAAKKLASSSFFGTIPVCRDHHYRRLSFCGLCLRESPAHSPHDTNSREFELSQSIGIIDNEDEDTWPSIEATCRRCRIEWLWRKANLSQRDREAIGGPMFRCSDWETRQNIEGFIEMAEGTIADVLTLAREKLWLRTCTKYDSLAQHLLAAQRTQPRSEMEEEEEDSEEDKELTLMRGSSQVREMALNDWARHRILDGHWLSPADVWYNHAIPGQPLAVPTVHPCPWSREMDGSLTAEDEQHPLQATVQGEVPPSFSLCEQAYIAHTRQFREILGPALKNIVRKIVMECSIRTEKGYEDPAHIARKMSMEQVVKILREEEGVWYDGVDWVEKKRNDDETLRRRRLEEAALMSVVEDKHQRTEDDSSSTTSSGSGKSSTHGSSNATSPVLSTSTLQTTPSPPPISDEGSGTKKDEESNERQRNDADGPRLIPVDPVRSTPRLLAKIPYVPVTIAHLPQYSLDALRSAWRDACIPLYHCCCSVCERAKAVEINARAAYAGIAPGVVPSQPVPQTLTTTIYPLGDVRDGIQTIDTTEIELKEANDADLDGEGEEEVDYDISDYEDEEEEEDDASLLYDAETGSYRYTVSPEAGAELQVPPSRKRSCDELDDAQDAPDDVSSETPSSRISNSDRRELTGTPPKRPRLGDADLAHIPSEELPEAAVTALLKKRNSEELEDEDASMGSVALTSNKRIRMRAPPSPSSASPRSIYSSSVDAEDAAYSSAGDEGEDMPYVPPSHHHHRDEKVRGIRIADMEKLIPMDDMDE